MAKDKKPSAEDLRRAEERDREDRRIARQRTLFTMLPNFAACDRLKAAMLQRAYDLMWDGNAEACDALLEFLPERDVGAMFDAWWDDQFSDKLKSKFYEPKV